MKQELLWREFFIWSGAAPRGGLPCPRRAIQQPTTPVTQRERFRLGAGTETATLDLMPSCANAAPLATSPTGGVAWVASHFINELRLPCDLGPPACFVLVVDRRPIPPSTTGKRPILLRLWARFPAASVEQAPRSLRIWSARLRRYDP